MKRSKLCVLLFLAAVGVANWLAKLVVVLAVPDRAGSMWLPVVIVPAGVALAYWTGRRL